MASTYQARPKAISAAGCMIRLPDRSPELTVSVCTQALPRSVDFANLPLYRGGRNAHLFRSVEPNRTGVLAVLNADLCRPACAPSQTRAQQQQHHHP